MRLFLAIALPRDVEKVLRSYQPTSEAYIRIVSQLHLTLHFLGDVKLAELETAMSDIRFKEFKLSLDGLGCFKANGKCRTLWAGVRPNEALRQLYVRIGKRLEEADFELYSHHYSPHISLARCQRKYSEEKIQHFLQIRTEPLEFRVDHFLLYGSEIINNVPFYRALAKYGAK
ncbi:RNA 2',3'-cyclic phosphodiesterase [Desulfotalea psychrophila]|uniref:RNA 2',3'-cyclic phosphodiesterase n=1 Tax=Desulfotalea psychrophila (strain LSv54 / DSM 12343) TaxID=177439 RepID=Q6AKT9_DESPS|nr:RNA 2',3'-cyclic phosphodiesterase [Desulfotalea psychrophila]CAG37036.1 hypothetical protein DP2307 [Desulfotalea psychrophila LSv54]